MTPIANFNKIDMHVHTEYSLDSTNSLKNIDIFLKKNMNFGLAITDHNQIEGALIMKDRYPDRIIIGEEIRTQQGEITGLFLKENIKSGKDINWTIDAILVQGGLVYIPHPCCRLRSSKLSVEALNYALKRCDIVEVFNSRNVFKEDDDLAKELVSSNIVPACGSDAHTRFEVGQSYVEIPMGTRLTPSGFLEGLSNGKLVGQRSSVLVHVYTKLYKNYIKYTKRNKR